jgi:hypothetical protein
VTVRELRTADLDWVVERLATRRAGLVPFAPVYWRPARDADQVHRRFLESVLGRGVVGFRTDDSVMIAAPGRGGSWTVDDASVGGDQWAGDGQLLWNAVCAAIGGGQVRLVCPAPEPERRRFAEEQGLRLRTSWWHATVGAAGRARSDGRPDVDGATATLVPAPPIYDPGGPILFLTDVRDASRALASAREEAARLGAPVVVVDQPATDHALDAVLTGTEFYCHCGFFTGTIAG